MDWRNDKHDFAKRFEISYEEFVELVNAFSNADRDRYDKIVALDERAAVLWAIDQGKKLGLLVEKAERPATQDPLTPPPGSFAAHARATLEHLDARDKQRG